MTRLNLQPYISYQVNLSGQFFSIFSCLLIYAYLLIKAVNNTPVFQDIRAYEHIAGEKKQKTDENYQAIFDHITALITEKSLFKTARLSLTDLAQESGLKTRQISRSINLCAGMNFSDFINELRINDVKQQIEQDCASYKSLLEMAFDAGFNSKSSFNTSFKKNTGMTPSQYLVDHQ